MAISMVPKFARSAIDRGLNNEIKSDRTDHIALQKEAFCGVFHIGRSKIAAFGRRRINVDCCADDTAE